MKNLFLAATLLFGMIGMAQTDSKSDRKGNRTEQVSPEKKIELRLEKMTKELNLTTTQQNDVRNLMIESQKSQMAKKEERKKMMEKRKEAMQTQRKAYDAKMGAILTAEQNTKWQQLTSENKEKRKEKMQGKMKDKKQGNYNRQKNK